jgi:hypothetical protein
MYEICNIRENSTIIIRGEIMKKIKKMKKLVLSISMVLLLILLTGCKKDNQNNADTTTPTQQPMVTTQPTVTPTVEDVTDEDNEDITGGNFTIQDFYPLQADVEYVYEGEGNEYASYHRYTDFVDPETNKIQTRTNNGGTETVRVIEIKDGKISVVSIINECYYRENIMDNETAVLAEEEILLMEPLVMGTQWTLPDGRKRTITGTNVPIETPSGSYKTIEVMTDSEEYTTKDYYAPKVGLVKEIFLSGEMEVSSTLSDINTEAPYTQSMEVFYPASDEKIYVEPITLTFHTGDDTKEIIQEVLRKEGSKESYLPLASANTIINSLDLDENNIVHLDFSKEFVQEMNLGAGYESLLLQSVTNTLGNYYGVSKVLITLDGKLYESGHVLMKEGETFEVNMEDVVR